jgi:hypothetical protein
LQHAFEKILFPLRASASLNDVPFDVVGPVP